MNKNVGGYDRIGRIVLGTILLLVGVAGYVGLFRVTVGPLPQALTALLVSFVGVVFLVTGGTQRCPLNAVFGVDTCERN
jgi:hypothetical protein